MDIPRYNTLEVSHAIHVPVSGIYRLHKIKFFTAMCENTGRNATRKYSLRVVYHYALMSKLIRYGFILPCAYELAEEFAYKGNSIRKPGELFSTGETWFVLDKPNYYASIVSGNPLPSCLPANAIVINLSTMVAEIRKILAVDFVNNMTSGSTE